MIPKFRAKDEKGVWHTGLLTFMFGQYAIVNESDENTVYLIDKETVGQYTGLKDQNGVEIFKGDICRDTDMECFGVVDYDLGSFVFECQSVCDSVSECYENLEVMGNIYENSNLLEVAK